VDPLPDVEWVPPASSGSLHVNIVPLPPWNHNAMGVLLPRLNAWWRKKGTIEAVGGFPIYSSDLSRCKLGARVSPLG